MLCIQRCIFYGSCERVVKWSEAVYVQEHGGEDEKAKKKKKSSTLHFKLKRRHHIFKEDEPCVNVFCDFFWGGEGGCVYVKIYFLGNNHNKTTIQDPGRRRVIGSAWWYYKAAIIRGHVVWSWQRCSVQAWRQRFSSRFIFIEYAGEVARSRRLVSRQREAPRVRCVEWGPIERAL